MSAGRHAHHGRRWGRADGESIQQCRQPFRAPCGALCRRPLDFIGHLTAQDHHAILHAYIDVTRVDRGVPVELGEDIVSELNVWIHENLFC